MLIQFDLLGLIVVCSLYVILKLCFQRILHFRSVVPFIYSRVCDIYCFLLLELLFLGCIADFLHFLIGVFDNCFILKLFQHEIEFLVPIFYIC